MHCVYGESEWSMLHQLNPHQEALLMGDNQSSALSLQCGSVCQLEIRVMLECAVPGNLQQNWSNQSIVLEMGLPRLRGLRFCQLRRQRQDPPGFRLVTSCKARSTA